MKMEKPDLMAVKLMIIVGALMIVVLSAIGFYLVDGEPTIKSLVTSGHSHGLCFATLIIVSGVIFMWLRGVRKAVTRTVAILDVVTLAMPIGLMTAGWTGNTGFLSVTSAIGGIALLVVWAMVIYLVAWYLPKWHEEKAAGK